MEIFDVYKEAKVKQMLSRVGSQGWELVHVSDSLKTYFFKRISKQQAVEELAYDW